MSEKYFKEIKKGDKVYFLSGIEGTVKVIAAEYERFEVNPNECWITFDGKYFGEEYIGQICFWQPPPKIDPPPRPKRKVIKMAECWVNFYLTIQPMAWRTLEESDLYGRPDRISGKSFHFIGQYTEEEP